MMLVSTLTQRLVAWLVLAAGSAAAQPCFAQAAEHPVALPASGSHTPTFAAAPAAGARAAAEEPSPRAKTESDSASNAIGQSSVLLLACALADQSNASDDDLACNPDLPRLLTRDGLHTSTRILSGKVRVWAAPATCADVITSADLNSRPECQYSTVRTNPGIPSLSTFVSSLKVGETSFDWLLFKSRLAKSFVIPIDEAARSLGWDVGKHVVISVVRKDGAQAFSFTYGWWMNPYDDNLAILGRSARVSLFFPVSLFAVGGDTSGLRAALMPLSIGIGTKFASWRGERYLGVGAIASYTVQTPTLVSGSARDSDETSNTNPFAIALGGVLDLSGKLYVGYAAVYDLSSESDFRSDRGLTEGAPLPTRWGHYLVLGSPLVALFK